ncbi:hypothetical protein [Mesorhizobium sp. WSM4884]|uniref:hypothetical protein n=1 Tax=Mesorhizobium sp. WSM4884 TaxID=3038542 RepID=UPI002416F059|nr:hypothetical protein [Mesorhizobium sp. WSM4884]MDG4884193.1 hypothetical protein [Mesorhizobium sp. WSM4884]
MTAFDTGMLKEVTVIAGRLRECMKVLRWDAVDLAQELNHPQSEVARWVDGRARIPLAVGAWIEALVKAHKALPPPGLLQSKAVAHTGPAAAIQSLEANILNHLESHGIVLQSPYPRRHASGGPRPDPIAVQSKGGSDHGTRPL